MKTSFTPITSSSYELLDGEDKIITRQSQTSCFASVTYGGVSKETKKFIYVVTENNTPFTLDEVEKYFELVTKLGFPMSVTKKGIYFRCEVKIKDYDNRLRFNSALTIMRYIGHHPFQRIVYQFIEGKEPKTLEKLFEKFEKAHDFSLSAFNDCPFNNPKSPYYTYNDLGNTNHCLKTSATVKGYETIMKRLKANTTSVHEEQAHVNVNGNWT